MSAKGNKAQPEWKKAVTYIFLAAFVLGFLVFAALLHAGAYREPVGSARS